MKKGFDFGRMVFGCVFVAFVSVFVWIMSDVFFAPSLKGYETIPCRIVKSSVKMEKVNRFIFTAEFAYEQHGRTYKSNSLRRPGHGEFEFSRLVSRLPLLERYAPGTEHECRVNPEEIESLEIVLEHTRMEGSGKYHRLIAASSQSCCHHVQPMVPGAGNFGFAVPERANDGCSMAFGAKVKVKSVRHAFTLAYPLPDPVA